MHYKILLLFFVPTQTTERIRAGTALTIYCIRWEKTQCECHLSHGTSRLEQLVLRFLFMSQQVLFYKAALQNTLTLRKKSIQAQQNIGSSYITSMVIICRQRWEIE